MSTPSESEPTLTTHFEFPRDSQAGESKPSTTAADTVGNDQHVVLKSGTIEDTLDDDSLQGSLDAKIVSEDLPAPTSTDPSPTTNVVPGADLAVPEIVASPQGADEGELWIPKGPESGSRPTGTPVGQTPRPTRPARPQQPPSNPKRDN